MGEAFSDKTNLKNIKIPQETKGLNKFRALNDLMGKYSVSNSPDEKYSFSVMKAPAGDSLVLNNFYPYNRELIIYPPITFSDIMTKLVMDTRTVLRSLSPELRGKIAFPVGFETDLVRIVQASKEYGFNKFVTTRFTNELLDFFEKCDIPPVRMTSIIFENENGQRISILYIGQGTTSSEFIYDLIYRISMDEQLDVEHNRTYDHTRKKRRSLEP